MKDRRCVISDLPWTWIGIAALLVFAAAVWAVFLRPVPRRAASGEIIQKDYKPGGVYWQWPTGDRTNFFTPTRIPIAECNVFVIRMDGQPVPAVFSLNTLASEKFSVGQRVDIIYEVRGIPLVWKVACVLEMRPAA